MDDILADAVEAVVKGKGLSFDEETEVLRDVTEEVKKICAIN